MFLCALLVATYVASALAQAPDKPERPPGEEPATGNPVISIDPPSWQLGEVPAGKRVEKVFTIKNSGGATLIIRSWRASGNNIAPDFRGGDRVEPGKSIQMTMTYLTSNTAQAVDSFVFITTNDPVNSPSKIAITGQVVVSDGTPSLESYLFYSEDSADVKEIRDTFKNDLPKLGLTPLCLSDIENMKKVEELEVKYRVTQRANLQLFVGGHYFFGLQVKKAIELLRDGKSLAAYAAEVAEPLLSHIHEGEAKTKLASGQVAPPPVVLDFFWAQGCETCKQKFQPLLVEHINPFGDAVLFREWNMQNADVVRELYRSVGKDNIPVDATIVAIVAGKNYMAGDERVIQEIKKLLTDAINEQNKLMPPVKVPDQSSRSFRNEDVTVGPATSLPRTDPQPKPTKPAVDATQPAQPTDSSKVTLLIMTCLVVVLVICLIVVITRTKPKS
jgi:thiol-disulfide isomerase/thioredoxin